MGLVQTAVIPPIVGLTAPVGTIAENTSTGDSYVRVPGVANTNWAPLYRYAISVTAYGADSTGATDSLAAIEAAMADAQLLGADLHFPGSEAQTYTLSKYVNGSSLNRIRIFGKAQIRYPSADTSLNADGIATSKSQAQSAFLFRYATDVTVEGLQFVGDQDPSSDVNNLGSAIYTTHCTGFRMTDCTNLFGHSLIQQDALLATSIGPPSASNSTIALSDLRSPSPTALPCSSLDMWGTS